MVGVCWHVQHPPRENGRPVVVFQASDAPWRPTTGLCPLPSVGRPSQGVGERCEICGAAAYRGSRERRPCGCREGEARGGFPSALGGTMSHHALDDTGEPLRRGDPRLGRQRRVTAFNIECAASRPSHETSGGPIEWTGATAVPPRLASAPPSEQSSKKPSCHLRFAPVRPTPGPTPGRLPHYRTNSKYITPKAVDKHDDVAIS